jgi:hypothetical protein
VSEPTGNREGRWIEVGRSSDPDPAEAAREAMLLARADARMLADKSGSRPRPTPALEPAAQAEPASPGSDLVGADLP